VNIVAQQKRNIITSFIFIIIIAIFTIVVLTIMNNNFVPKTYYKASDFNIKTLYSDFDYDMDNIDDYSAFVFGARKDAQKKPIYISKYYEDSYPPDNEGVCTDVIWRAFKQAGYSLRDMIDEDIKNNPTDYPHIKYRDKNIDFRRVINQKIFFEKYSLILTTNTKQIGEWQPGDIVIFEDKHIGIISDRRNRDGVPFVIHNGGQQNREEDYLTKKKITGHYRFDATRVDKNILQKW
jgi:uncharacterized protein YijF (DUF1287 family)